MPYADLVGELRGAVPKLPPDYAYTLVNRAYADTRRKNLWSFQLFESNWFSPAVVNAGTVTTRQGSNQVVFNAAASAAILALGLVPSPITSRQFRISVYTVYNIWGIDNNAGIVTLTLDRPMMESSVTASPYSIFQCYYPAPMKDFKAFLSVRDPTNRWTLCTTRNRDWVDEQDPQRENYTMPRYVVPSGTNQNPLATTYGWMMFELWGQPQYTLPYIIYGIRKGVDLMYDTDTLPSAIGEDCVAALARAYAYEWAEGNKGDVPRSQGSDFRFLIEEAKNQYIRLWREYRREDRELVDLWVTTRRSSVLVGAMSGYYNAFAGVASAGVD